MHRPPTAIKCLVSAKLAESLLRKVVFIPSPTHPAIYPSSVGVFFSQHTGFRVLAAFALCGLATATNVEAGLPAQVERPPRISLSVPSQADAGTVVLARGRTSPRLRKVRVSIQLSWNRRWKTVGGGVLQNRSFSFRFRLPADRETVRVRAVLSKHGATLSRSPVRTVHMRPHASVAPPAPSASSSPPTLNSDSPTPVTEDPLSATSLMSSVEQYARFPNHLSDTATSVAALDEFSAALGDVGLQLGQQAFTYPEFSVSAVGLSADGHSVPAAAIAPYLYSGTTGAGGVTATLFDGGDGTFDASQVAGKIVVASLASPNNSSSPKLYPAIEAAVEGGAKAFVGVTQAVGDYPKWENSNARRGTGPMPVLLVGKHSGAAVIAAAQSGKLGTATLAASTSGLACERDVWGELEGAEPSRRVFIATPVSSFTPSASEHGSAYAIVIGLARHYAALPKSARPETLVFMAMGGHEVGWLGLQALLNSSHGEWFRSAAAYIHLGSGLGAPTAKEEPDGTVTTTPTPDPSGQLHDSENPLLEPSILEDFAVAGVPTNNKPPHEASGGEQTYAYAAGIPMVSFSGASLYFHTAGDLPSVVDPAILAKDADAFRRTVDTIAAIPSGQLKAANTTAETYGEAINPDNRAPINPTLLSNRSGGPPATPVSSCP
jgi:hypothetical protein